MHFFIFLFPDNEQKPCARTLLHSLSDWLDYGIEVKHVQNLSRSISDKKNAVTIEKMEYTVEMRY